MAGQREQLLELLRESVHLVEADDLRVAFERVKVVRDRAHGFFVICALQERVPHGFDSADSL